MNNKKKHIRGTKSSPILPTLNSTSPVKYNIIKKKKTNPASNDIFFPALTDKYLHPKPYLEVLPGQKQLGVRPFSVKKSARSSTSSCKRRNLISSTAERWEEWIFSKDKYLDPPIDVETPDSIRQALKNSIENPEDNKPILVRHATFNLIPTDDMTAKEIVQIKFNRLERGGEIVIKFSKTADYYIRGEAWERWRNFIYQLQLKDYEELHERMDVLYGMSLLHNIEDLLYKGIKHIAFGKWRNKYYNNATIIQKIWRSYIAKKIYRIEKLRHNINFCATIIQCAYRCYKAKKLFKVKLINYKATVIQCNWRVRKAQKILKKMKYEFNVYSDCSVVIQSLIRGHLARIRVSAMKKCLLIVTPQMVEKVLKNSRQIIGKLQMHYTMRKIKNVDYQEIINSINLSMEMVHHYKQYLRINQKTDPNYYVFLCNCDMNLMLYKRLCRSLKSPKSSYSEFEKQIKMSSIRTTQRVFRGHLGRKIAKKERQQQLQLVRAMMVLKWKYERRKLRLKVLKNWRNKRKEIFNRSLFCWKKYVEWCREEHWRERIEKEMIIAEEHYHNYLKAQLFKKWRILSKCIYKYKIRIYKTVMKVWKIEARRLYIEKIKPLGELMEKWMDVVKAEKIFKHNVENRMFNRWHMYTKIQRFHFKYLTRIIIRAWYFHYKIEKLYTTNIKRRVMWIWKLNKIQYQYKKQQEDKAYQFWCINERNHLFEKWIEYLKLCGMHNKYIGNIYMMILPYSFWNADYDQQLIVKADKYYHSLLLKIQKKWIKKLWKDTLTDRQRMTKARNWYERKHKFLHRKYALEKFYLNLKTKQYLTEKEKILQPISERLKLRRVLRVMYRISQNRRFVRIKSKRAIQIYKQKIFLIWLQSFRRRKIVRDISNKSYNKLQKLRSIRWWHLLSNCRIYYRNLVTQFMEHKGRINKELCFKQWKHLLMQGRWKKKIKNITLVQSIIRRHLSMKRYKYLKTKSEYIQEIAIQRETCVEHLTIDNLGDYLRRNEWVYVLFWADWLNSTKQMKYRVNFAHHAYDLTENKHLKCKFVIADSNTTSVAICNTCKKNKGKYRCFDCLKDYCEFCWIHKHNNGKKYSDTQHKWDTATGIYCNIKYGVNRIPAVKCYFCNMNEKESKYSEKMSLGLMLPDTIGMFIRHVQHQAKLFDELKNKAAREIQRIIRGKITRMKYHKLYIKWNLEEYERSLNALAKQQDQFNEDLNKHWIVTEHATLQRQVLFNEISKQKKFGAYLEGEEDNDTKKKESRAKENEKEKQATNVKQPPEKDKEQQLPPQLETPEKKYPLAVVCMDCEEKVANFFCVVCQIPYCKDCCATFHKNGERAYHELIYINLALLNDRGPICNDCNFKEATSYCQNCKLLYCGECTKRLHITKNRHRHKDLSIDEYISQPALFEKGHYFITDRELKKAKVKKAVSEMIAKKMGWKIAKEIKIKPPPEEKS